MTGAKKICTFPYGFTLGDGAQATLHSGSAVWNDGGNTVYVYDDSDSLVLEEPY